MAIVDVYIGKVVATSVAVVLVVVAALLLFAGVAAELDDIGSGRYTFWAVAIASLFELPTMVYQGFPLMALLGTIFGLGILATHSELTAMRSAGISAPRIVGAVLKTAAVLIIVAVAMGELLAPPLAERAKRVLIGGLAQQVEINAEHGLWARQGRDFVHIRHVDSDGVVHGLEVYTFDADGALTELVEADRGQYAGSAWQLQGVARTRISSDAVVRELESQTDWESVMQPELIGVVATDPDTMASLDLYAYVSYLKTNGLESGRYELALWSRLFMPLTIVAMVMLAVPFVFGSLRTVGMGARGFAGFVVGVIFYMANQIAGQTGVVYHLHPALSAGVPTIVVLTLAIVLVRRVT